MPAHLAHRMWSALFDSLAIVGWLVAIALLQPWPDSLPGVVKAATWFLPPLFVEPTSIFLAERTLGQSIAGLRVRSVTGRPLTFPRLLARHVAKFGLLGFSAFYIPFTHRRQALHDALFGTVVLSGGTGDTTALPPPEPIRLGAFLWSLVLASFASLSFATLLAIVFVIAVGTDKPGEFANSLFELIVNVAAGLVFILFMIRRGRFVRRRAAAQQVASADPSSTSSN